jgi:hypothetical protein
MSHKFDTPPTNTVMQKSLRNPRNVGEADKLVLCGAAAGRCSMCNDVVIHHHLTGDAGNFSQAAHIWAFSETGPRGNSPGRPEDPDTIENLIFLCAKCHKLVDDHPEEYPVQLLIQIRTEHVDRVRYLTDCIPAQKTDVITLSAKVGGQPNTLLIADIREAVRPLYPLGKPFAIDFDAITGESPEEIQVIAKQLDDRINNFIFQRGSSSAPVALFGIAPIPLLINVGRSLGNKVDTRLFQLHRGTNPSDPISWTWKSDGDTVVFEVVALQKNDSKTVALMVHVSGANALDLLPQEYISGNVYEIRPVRVIPSRTLMRRYEDLMNFRTAYREALTLIAGTHRAREVGLFPAVPIPCAFAMGLDLLPKADPKLKIYDFRNGNFIQTITT